MYSCRFCNHPLVHTFIDLGNQPPSNSFLSALQLDDPEIYYQLKVYVCEKCFLVQLPEHKLASEIFIGTYPYYSSQSPRNVSHAKDYVKMMVNRFEIGRSAVVWEIGSNDGYLLQHFNDLGIECHGIEPSEGPANVAIGKGISTIKKFFTPQLANDMSDGMGQADIICSINTLAHQPDLDGFIEAIKIGLKPGGITTHEFPHLMRLVVWNQFDTIYHEHYSYFSFATICEIFEKHLLSVFDVDEIPEHGGSLRIYAEHSPSCRQSEKMRELLLREGAMGMFTTQFYSGFQQKADTVKTHMVRLLIDAKMEGKKVCAYGAPAKGNTLLNYCGVRPDLIPFTVDRSPHKQGKYLPGSHIPVKDEAALKKFKPEYVLILAWNLKDEIMQQLAYIREWGGKFVVAIPELRIL